MTFSSLKRAKKWLFPFGKAGHRDDLFRLRRFQAQKFQQGGYSIHTAGRAVMTEKTVPSF